jgi:CBS domain-containing protein
MKCEDVMKTVVECVSPEDTVLEAAQRMRDQHVGFLPVCGESKEILGTLTDRDIAIRLVADGRPGTTPVAEVMSREIVACRADDSIKRAEQLMSEQLKSRIMCADDDGHLVGVISLSDIAQQDTGHAVKVLRRLTLREARE